MNISYIEFMEHMAHMEHRPKSETVELPSLIHFGKYKGWPISEACRDEKYLDWILQNDMVRLGIALSQIPQVRERLED